MTLPDGFRGLLRTVALIAVVAGATGSIGLLLRVGYRNDAVMPVILLFLFTGWVLSPFVALVLVDRVSKRWSVATRATLHWVMLIVTLVSLGIYGAVALSPPRPKPAAIFLLVPLGSWLLIAVVVPLAARVSRTATPR